MLKKKAIYKKLNQEISGNKSRRAPVKQIK